MKKRVLYILVAVIFLIIAYFSIKKYDTDFYLILVGNAQFNKLDMKVEIDNSEIYNDSICYICDYQQKKYKKVTYPIRQGFHEVKVSSNKAGVLYEKRIFVLFNQYVVVEYYGVMESIRDIPEFSIITKNKPFTYYP